MSGAVSVAEGGERRHIDCNNSSTIRRVNQESVTPLGDIPLTCCRRGFCEELLSYDIPAPPQLPGFTNSLQGGSRNSKLNIQLRLTYPLPSLGSRILHKDQPQAQHFLDLSFPATAELSSEDAETLPRTLKALSQGSSCPAGHTHTQGSSRQGVKGSQLSMLRSGWGLGKCFKIERGVGRSSGQ